MCRCLQGVALGGLVLVLRPWGLDGGEVLVRGVQHAEENGLHLVVEELLGCGALKELDPSSGELKSMRTATPHLRRGVASRMLEHLLSVARSRGYARVSLETGSGPAFEPALVLYRSRGFVDGPAFGDYAATEFNQFLHLDLRALPTEST